MNTALHEVAEQSTVQSIPVAPPAPAASPLLAVKLTTEKIKQDLRMGREHQQGRINWITTIFMGLFHVGAIAALFFFSWKNLAAFFVMYFFAINVGIGMAYHRLLTHRGYRVPRLLEYFLTACGCLALEGGPIFWVATHRVHHQNSDHEGDPHTPHDGTWWAGSSPAALCTPRPLCWAAMLPT
jgi:fatty-acid desaturase